MKLYYSPGACSLADRIALHEGGISSDFERVDLKAKKTETEADFRSINPKGYVPALLLDNGEIVTENIAVLAWISDHAPSLTPSGPMGRTRTLEALAFISTELHKGFKPFFSRTATHADRASAREALAARFELIAKNLTGPYLLGARFSVADAYLFVTLRWAMTFGIPVPAPLNEYFQRVRARACVRRALTEEGLEPAADSQAAA